MKKAPEKSEVKASVKASKPMPVPKVAKRKANKAEIKRLTAEVIAWLVDSEGLTKPAELRTVLRKLGKRLRKVAG